MLTVLDIWLPSRSCGKFHFCLLCEMFLRYVKMRPRRKGTYQGSLNLEGQLRNPQGERSERRVF